MGEHNEMLMICVVLLTPELKGRISSFPSSRVITSITVSCSREFYLSEKSFSKKVPWEGTSKTVMNILHLLHQDTTCPTLS